MFLDYATDLQSESVLDRQDGGTYCLERADGVVFDLDALARSSISSDLAADRDIPEEYRCISCHIDLVRLDMKLSEVIRWVTSVFSPEGRDSTALPVVDVADHELEGVSRKFVSELQFATREAMISRLTLTDPVFDDYFERYWCSILVRMRRLLHSLHQNVGPGRIDGLTLLGFAGSVAALERLTLIA